MKVEVSITELTVGQYVVEIASQNGTFTLTKSSHIKSEGVIQNLKSKGVLSVIIDTDKTLSPSKTKPKPKHKQLTAVDFDEAKEIFNQSKQIQKKIFEDALNDSEIDLAPINEITQQTIDKAVNSPSSLACAINIREKDEYLLEHSVAVSVLMCIFAQHLKVDKDKVQQLVVGAFLHDVGKIMIPDKILNKPGKLTDEEFVIMKTHASHSIDIIKKTPGISPLSLEVAALHHEKINGFGYPNQVKGDDITKFGRMIAICDIFDALTAHRCYKQGFTHLKAFSILKELVKDNHLDGELVDEFIRCIGAFPIGSLVQLESKKLAIVERRNPNDPIKPKVRSFYSTKHKHFVNIHDIDLSKSDDKIVKAVRADDFDLDLNKITEMLIMEG
ncbi:HD-GYP domain-containing protein [Thalassotalea sp. M1531]|uniref:HD-GYP domain-containing protein n=1 Tax=Thalassotalea algicola TaxID=2716224 RepID=A0A7Y0Q637_9GAMM|nr:HD-GYP domain-containing protein [Thalassotalea algicola]NMP30978.1 HD-GYP domain-containing protein [Thalassotalea algicola]